MIRKLAFTVLTFLFSLSLVTTCTVLADQWWFRAGGAYRGDMSVQVKGSSHTQVLGIHAVEEYRKDPSGIGPSREYSDREYDDGFVYQDVATAFDGQTWYWGWEDAGQFDGGSQTLSFMRGGGVAYHRETLLDISASGDDDLDAAGISFMAGRRLPVPTSLRDSKIRFDAVIGVQGFWNSDSRMRGTTFRERITRDEYVVVDEYDVGYDLTASPASPPPYEGNYFGPGPVIPEQPTDRKRHVTNRKIWEAENRVDMRIRSSLLELSIGPKTSFELSDKVAFYAIPSISATFLDFDIERDEQFIQIFPNGSTETMHSWNDDVCEQEWLLGFGIQLGVDVALTEDWFAGLHLGYDWLDEAEVTVGPNTVSIDPTGFTVGAEVGRRL